MSILGIIAIGVVAGATFVAFEIVGFFLADCFFQHIEKDE